MQVHTLKNQRRRYSGYIQRKYGAFSVLGYTTSELSFQRALKLHPSLSPVLLLHNGCCDFAVAFFSTDRYAYAVTMLRFFIRNLR